MQSAALQMVISVVFAIYSPAQRNDPSLHVTAALAAWEGQKATAGAVLER